MKKKLKLVSQVLFAGLLSASGAASAISTINFNPVPSGEVDEFGDPIVTGGMPGSVAGYANVSGNCVACYHETTADGEFVMGTLSDLLGSNHVHGETNNGSSSVGYHNDSSGVYIRRADGGAFTAFSLYWDTINSENPKSGVWEILGFNTAYNTSALTGTVFGNIAAEGDALHDGDGSNYPSRVAYQTVTQSGASPRTEGTLTLNSDFNDADGINAIWIHFKGTGSSGANIAGNSGSGYLTAAEANALGASQFKVNIDDVVVGSVAAVPVPGAVWMFGSGLLGLLSFARRRAA
ncbi:hypothetical protein [Methylomonas rosea]|uniref:Secreted protein n=1 Tax=Methylomonas rosea TaxID=2952227 RepID=A0ABT1TR69_9GAMM|nr:hypothetical protein [Methylomonas sp. WSC-7]MCQ8117265.1 hypothetical protein [Methylomonas sp. WSC-7]